MRVIGLIGMLLMWVLGVAAFLAISIALLWIGGRFMPLAGRGRRRG